MVSKSKVRALHSLARKIQLNESCKQNSRIKHTYLARRLTVIMKAVPPGRGCPIALRDG